MSVKNDNKLIREGIKWRMNRKKLLIVSGTPDGKIRYEDLFDEAIENYQCYMSFHSPLNPRETWDGIFDMMRKGSLSFEEIRSQYSLMVRKGVSA